MDRCLTQWILAGKLEGVRGIILGDFHGLQSRRIFEVLAAQMDLDIPVVHCPYVGHVANKITLPVGAEVELTTETKQLIVKNLNFPGAKT